MTFRICFSLILLLSSCVSVVASTDSWFARTWQSDDGLPDNNVTGVVQTQDGYLWVATTAGLARFDGVRFQQFSPLHSSTRVIRAMMLDRQGRLWIELVPGQVVCIGPQSVRVFSGPDLPDLQPLLMTESADGTIWIVYKQGVVIRIQDNKVVRIPESQALSPGSLTWFATDANGRLWFARDNQVGTVNGEHFQTLLRLPAVPVHLTGSRNGGLWIVAGSRVFTFIHGQLEERVRLPSRATPTSLLEDRAGALWISTVRHGLFRYNGHILEDTPISHKMISSLSEDREGNIWVGSLGGGLTRLRPHTIELANLGNGLSSEGIRSVTEDMFGSLWIVTQDGLLVHGQQGSWKIVSTQRDWPGGEVMTVVADPSGAVWIGTRNHGLVRLQHKQFEVWPAGKGPASNAIRSLLVSSNGDLWLGTDSPYKLQRLHNGTWHTFDLPPSARLIRAMAEDMNGDLWAGTADGGLFRIRRDSFIEETSRVGTRHSIRCLRVTRDGSLWIAYSDLGVGWWKDGKLRVISTPQGLWDRHVSQIVDDGHGHLWLAANHGIFRVDLEEMKAVAELRAARLHPIVFGRAEGLPSLEGSHDGVPGALLGRDGRIWMATRAGLALIHIENIRENAAPPPVLIERVLVDGRSTALDDNKILSLDRTLGQAGSGTGDLSLPANYRKIQFKFTALSFSAPENVRLRYRLQGFDEDWVETEGERSATYSRLSPGKYRFAVVASNDLGIWNEVGAAVGIEVPPLYWQTWWFRIMALAALSLLIALLVRYVSWRRLRLALSAMRQEAALNNERARIAQDLHDDLGAQLTQATLLLELASENGASGNRHVAEGLDTVREAIRSLDETVWAVNPRNNTLSELIDYIAQFALEFLARAQIRSHLELPDPIPDHPVSFELRHHIFLIVKEALNNVVRHAHAREVHLHITVDESGMTLVVQDDGCGFQEFAKDAQADGLRNMRQRAEGIGGQFDIDSRLGIGTRISLLYRWPNLRVSGGSAKSLASPPE